MKDILRIALQKSGRLNEDSVQLIRRCGINIPTQNGTLKSAASNFPVEFLYLRDDDIPGYVSDGVADLGIVGDNVAAEKGKEIDKIEYLGFGQCRLSIAVPKSRIYSTINDLNGLSIATSYPNILSNFLKNKNIKADIHQISGSVEIAPGIGLADAICDLVSSGSTLLSNGLKEVEEVFRSEAVLIGNKNLSNEKKEILKDLLFRIKSVRKAQSFKYILLNAPDTAIEKISAILPGMKSPTIMPLAEKGWISMHSVVEENAFWEIINNLKQAGAQGILVLPIEKMIV